MISLMQQRHTTFEFKNYRDLTDWDEFVNSHPQGSIFHCKSMIEAEARTKLHEPFAFGAVDSQGNLLALLVAIRVAVLGGLPSLLNSRSIMYAEPIHANSAVGRMAAQKLIEYHDQYMSGKTLFAEVRPAFDPNSNNLLDHCGYRRLGYLNYELQLTPDVDKMFASVGPKVRNNVRCARRTGIDVYEVDPLRNLDTIYDLVSQSYAHGKVPLVDKSHFSSAFELFRPDNLRVLVANKRNEPFAVGCFLSFKNRVICWYAGTKRLAATPAMTGLFWEAIRKFAQEGMQIFDFAGAGWEGEDYGPGKFKKKFGGQLTNYGRFRKVYSPKMLQAAQTIYQGVRELIAPRVKSLSLTSNEHTQSPMD